MMKNLILSSVLLATQLFSMSSHSALFDDAEARKKILEVEKSMQSQNQATQSAINDLKQSQEQRDAIARNALADMQSQLDALKQENARLKGELEVANHKVETALQRQKDLYTDIDERLRKIESAPTAEVAATPAVAEKDTQEYQLLELANGLSKESKHKDAFNAYDKFLKDYPTSSYAHEAMYGLGYSQFALKNYKSSIATQQKLIDTYADSPKLPDAMFNMANSQIQLGLVLGAKKTLRDLIAKFPNSELTPTAHKRLKALEAIR
ncbi:MAG: YbgF trimerization domain-containing protein [Methylotenera sp.]|uniref:YbgF trimerization domain-containing protein n=1 Tax=Methylotenera sp. TaxID=2051956 RepID=UPI0027271202|nr:YbgF trimerization domain-containing protein [Methylotenera sp.]MDO9150017.1 YbgF trimerization domain-containing protein [Methylotenera sp.]